MDHPFPYSDTNKRYHTYDYYLKKTYGTKCARIPIDGGFTCPNRVSGTGCTYCSARGSGDFCADGLLPPEVQFAKEYERLTQKWGRRLPAIPYFQAYSGTFAPLAHLRALYDGVFSYRYADGTPADILALIIATRPDCLPPDVVAYLAELGRRTDLVVELGLQSADDGTLRRIRRGHDRETFLRGYHALREAGIAVCIHIINGLPTEGASVETREQMLATADFVASLAPQFLKIHMLHILRGTPMEEEYLRGEIRTLTQEAYVDIVCEQLTRLPPETVICRLTGDGPADDVIAPLWTKNKRGVLAAIDKQLAAKQIWQGYHFQKNISGNI